MIFGIFFVLKFDFMYALDFFEKDFWGKNCILLGKVLYMWTAMCRNVFDVFADSDLYLTDGLQT